MRWSPNPCCHHRATTAAAVPPLGGMRAVPSHDHHRRAPLPHTHMPCCCCDVCAITGWCAIKTHRQPVLLLLGMLLLPLVTPHPSAPPHHRRRAHPRAPPRQVFLCSFAHKLSTIFSMLSVSLASPVRTVRAISAAVHAHVHMPTRPALCMRGRADQVVPRPDARAKTHSLRAAP